MNRTEQNKADTNRTEQNTLCITYSKAYQLPI